MDLQTIDTLVASARAAMIHACCEYSGFPVAAALLASNGSVFIGVNVESSSYGGTICAERVALSSALTAGVREFVAIAVATESARPTMPCGICRQLLHDYAPDITVISDAGGAREVREIRTLLPDAFGRNDLSH